jgi:hypothetical protein
MALRWVVDAGCHGGRELRLPSLPPRLLRGCLTQEKYGSQKLAAISGAQPPSHARGDVRWRCRQVWFGLATFALLAPWSGAARVDACHFRALLDRRGRTGDGEELDPSP